LRVKLPTRHAQSRLVAQKPRHVKGAPGNTVAVLGIVIKRARQRYAGRVAAVRIVVPRTCTSAHASQALHFLVAVGTLDSAAQIAQRIPRTPVHVAAGRCQRYTAARARINSLACPPCSRARSTAAPALGNLVTLREGRARVPRAVVYGAVRQCVVVGTRHAKHRLVTRGKLVAVRAAGSRRARH
jgi:Zn finger protein HypA/HybF involved in hydrogenase expression